MLQNRRQPFRFPTHSPPDCAVLPALTQKHLIGCFVLSAGGQGIFRYWNSRPFGHILPSVESVTKAFRFALRLLRKLADRESAPVLNSDCDFVLSSLRTRCPVTSVRMRKPSHPASPEALFDSLYALATAKAQSVFTLWACRLLADRESNPDFVDQNHTSYR